MLWQATVSTPTTPAFGAGSLELIQIVTPNDSYTVAATPTSPAESYSDPLNGIMGLDATYPYGHHVYTESPNTAYVDSDSPGNPLYGEGPSGSDIPNYSADASSFVDYLMYSPPAASTADSNFPASQWITLAQYNWSVDGKATIPSTKNWADYSAEHSGTNPPDSAGTVNPTGSNPFASVYGPAFYPSWTTVDIEKHFPGP